VNERLPRAGDALGETMLVWNGMVSRVPPLIVRPRSVQEVAAAAGFARNHGLRLSIKREGRHGPAKSIAERAVTLDLSHLRDVVVDAEAELVHAGPGCLPSDVERAAGEHGRAVGFGFEADAGGPIADDDLVDLTRRLDRASEALEEVEMVIGDGTILVANRVENADLFWAFARGTGYSGTVTRLTFRLAADRRYEAGSEPET
jgi:FAD/FMN-containing dehydrogenase